MATHKYIFLSSLTALSLITSLPSFAAPAGFESGFYFGAKMGAQESLASWEQNSSAAHCEKLGTTGVAGCSELGTSFIDDNGQSFHTNLMGNVSLGYAAIMDQFFLALEGSFNIATDQELDWRQSDTAELSSPGGAILGEVMLNTHTTVTLENPDLILDFRPGVLLTKSFLLYGRVGTAFNRLSMQQDATLDFIHGTPPPSVSSSEENSVFGLRVGLGVEYKLTQQLSIAMDYVFTDYGDIDDELTHLTQTSGGKIASLATAITSQITSDAHASVTKNTTTLGFNWYFGGSKTHNYRGMAQ